jgi:hypothetical protein
LFTFLILGISSCMLSSWKQGSVPNFSLDVRRWTFDVERSSFYSVSFILNSSLLSPFSL